MCRPDRDYCSERHNPPFALVECIDNNIGLCRHRCPLGRPSLPNTVTAGRRCASVCPSGYFLGKQLGEEVCLLHRVSCPHGQTVILLGTSWHDTVCGHLEHYEAPDLSTHVKSKAFRYTLNELTKSWVRHMSFDEVESCAGRWTRIYHRPSVCFTLKAC
ncbi:hypothetical protein DPEC_G00363940 [Dallia pectoralis]|nr:hypothetical protein DPEC_G00363940 [Dallia pectoralis]